jgi:hypothetical protein
VIDDDELLAGDDATVFVGAEALDDAFDTDDPILNGTCVLRVDAEVGVRGVHEEVRPAEKLVRVLERPCTSRSACIARWNNRVRELYSL